MVKQDSAWDHPDRCAQPVHHRGQVQGGDPATGGCHDPHGGQQLTCAVHIDAELLENRRAVGPDGHGTPARRHVWPLVEDGDVVSVAQQPAGDGNAAHAGADNQDPKLLQRTRRP